MEEATTNERDGLVQMRDFITEFLNSGEGSPKVREYISSVIDDDSLLLVYLRGRKHRGKHAWETLKRNAEVRFDEYPESFLGPIPETFTVFLNDGVFGILKARDQYGRRIACFNGGKWDPSVVTLDQMSVAATYFLDKLLADEDFLKSGLICIQNCDGMGLKHAKQYSFRTLRRQLNIYYYAYPIRFKGIYVLNAPTYYRYIYKIIKPFLSQKLKDRIFISTSERQFEALHENVSPTILPKFLGGALEKEDAFDLEIFGIKK